MPLRLIPPEFPAIIVQGPLRGKRWIVGSSNHGCWLGSYEQDKAQQFAASVQSGAVVYDVGAHVGFYTLLASQSVGPGGRVVSFEPVPRNVAYLSRHIHLNHIENVTIIEAAVGDSNGSCSFLESDASLEGHIDPEGQLLVQSVRLDDLVTGGRIPAPNVIKIDVEGAEASVLAGAATLVQTHRPIIFLAVHGNAARRACLEFLRSYEYRLMSLDTSGMDDTSELLATPPVNLGIGNQL